MPRAVRPTLGLAVPPYRAAETRRTGPQVTILQPQPVPTAVRARFFPGEDRAALVDLQAEGARLADLAVADLT